jgi:hypothetical protein
MIKINIIACTDQRENVQITNKENDHFYFSGMIDIEVIIYCYYGNYLYFSGYSQH